MKPLQPKRWLKSLAILAFWLCVWQGVSMAVGNSILLVGPAAVLEALFSQAASQEFWITIAYSFWRILLGFLCALAAGLATGSLSYAFSWFGELLNPLVLLMKSVPIASFVILALIWIGSDYLSAFVSFVVVYPIIHLNTVAGLLSTDHKLLEMATVFRVPLLSRVRYLHIPALLPYLSGSLGIAIGMGIRSGVAAEVIGISRYSIGEQIYMSKIYLDTAGLFAWTLVVILITWMLERLLQSGIERYRRDQNVH